MPGFEEFPEAILPMIDMHQPNDAIFIHEGSFDIVSLGTPNSDRLNLIGKVWFEWLPTLTTRFLAKEGDPRAFHLAFSSASAVELWIDGLMVGVFGLYEISIGKSGSSIEGYSIDDCVLGEKSITVTSVKFGIPNLRGFLGSSTKIKSSNQTNVHPSRLILTNQNFDITIDKIYNFEEREKLVRRTGGYFLLYWGEIKPKSKTIDIDEAKSILECVDAFISLLNGRKTASLFIQGIFESDPIWTFYKDHEVSTYKNVPSWPAHFSIDSIDAAWQSFYQLWSSDGGEDFLNAIIHWYVEANDKTVLQRKSQPIESAIVLAQNGMELIYNWWIIENKRIITGKDSESISAANKIRLILTQLNVQSSYMPASFRFINALVNPQGDVKDTIDAIVLIRNAVVHSQVEKRIRLKNIHINAKMEALIFSLWLIEISLLRILEFKSEYNSRVAGAKWKGEDVVELPWLIKNKPE